MLGCVVWAAVRAGTRLCLEGSEKKAPLVASPSRAFSGAGFVLSVRFLAVLPTADEF